MLQILYMASTARVGLLKNIITMNVTFEATFNVTMIVTAGTQILSEEGMIITFFSFNSCNIKLLGFIVSCP